MSWKPLFSGFLSADPARLHLAAHSHHPWPDATFEAQQRYWLDSARLMDRKWDHVFGSVVPEAQRRIASILGLPDPNTIAFAPSTHDFVLRILSCFPPERPVQILTTDSEFHSFTRQSHRLEEEGLAVVERVKQEPIEDFPERFAAACRHRNHDLAFFSQVFFNSGYAVPDLGALVRAVPNDATFVVVDGYHGFMARPTDLAAVADRAFYMAGGYKYAMAGEGACFLHVPPGYGERPRDTGWFAAFGALTGAQDGRVPYAPDGARFLGATFDPSGLYRLSAALGALEEAGLTPARIHEHVSAVAEAFVATIDAVGIADLARDRLVVGDPPHRGNFVTYRSERAGDLAERLGAAGIVVDHRADRLRFGFGVYHDLGDVPEIVDRIAVPLR